jgi:ABC-type branched-subunit amino acid transport system permease subunit
MGVILLLFFFFRPKGILPEKPIVIARNKKLKNVSE